MSAYVGGARRPNRRGWTGEHGCVSSGSSFFALPPERESRSSIARGSRVHRMSSVRTVAPPVASVPSPKLFASPQKSVLSLTRGGRQRTDDDTEELASLLRKQPPGLRVDR
ncbi:hypothetical protein TGVEG_441550 [Toxoplasma gondii VEG]|uniref:Uncharacterized protein n=1 Tax=Toxoplasma gondii (strain ATCC 50861 / VEG) TaxID=432359 RepID=V4YMA4_TOXGV|nr:hypothetical protein TGVEG_441550 [Toxoplasma gondii VEG]